MLFNITLAGAVFLFAFKYVQFRKNSNSKNELDALQAKVSMLRMALKSKVKKKANSFRAKFVKPINSGDSIDLSISELCENKFEKGEDFQAYFDLSKRINSYVNAEMKSNIEVGTSNQDVKNKIEDFMGSDIKNELAIIRIIKEMTDTTTKYNAKADSFNKANPKSKTSLLDPLIFPALADVSRIFNDDSANRLGKSDHFDAA